MALITCPECGHKVSSQAKTCPSCGHPLHALISVISEAKSNGDSKPHILGNEANPITVQATAKEYKVKKIWGFVFLMIGFIITALGMANFDKGIVNLGFFVLIGAFIFLCIVSFQSWYKHG